MTSAANGRGKRPNQNHNPGDLPHSQKRTIHLLQNRTSLLALNTFDIFNAKSHSKKRRRVQEGPGVSVQWDCYQRIFANAVALPISEVAKTRKLNSAEGSE